MTKADVVNIDNLSLVFNTNDGAVHALQDIDFKISKGDFVSLIGPSGCGKTTLLRVIADLQLPTSGSIKVNGKSPERARTERDYGYVFQSPALFPWRTISGNIGLPLEIDPIMSAIIEIGNKLNIATPMLKHINSILKLKANYLGLYKRNDLIEKLTI